MKALATKVGRRGFLGLIGGAAASGPTLAKTLAEEGPRLGSSWPSNFGPGPAAYEECAAEPWHVRRIAELREMLRGGVTDEDRRRDEIIKRERLEQAERMRLDGLRSVSPSYKVSMLIRADAVRSEELRRVRVGLELAELIKQYM